MARRQLDQLHAPAGEEWVGADEERVGPLVRNGCEGGIDLAAVLALNIWICNPMARAAASTSRNWFRVLAGPSGLTSTASGALGTSSCSSSSRFAVSSD